MKVFLQSLEILCAFAPLRDFPSSLPDYDIDYAGRFVEIFSGLDIGKNPTAEHNTYPLLDFN